MLRRGEGSEQMLRDIMGREESRDWRGMVVVEECVVGVGVVGWVVVAEWSERAGSVGEVEIGVDDVGER